MKILFVSSHLNPFEKPLSGDAQRTQLLLRACAEIGRVDVLTFQKGAVSNIDNVSVAYSGSVQDYDLKTKKIAKWFRLLKLWDIYSLFPQNPYKAQVVDDIVRNGGYDYIVVRYMYKALECGLWKYRDRLIVDFDDALSSYFINELKVAYRLTTRIRIAIMAREAEWMSRSVIKKTYCAFFANPIDARKNKAVLLPNVPYYTQTCETADFLKVKKRIVFVGVLGYPPNYNGIEHFLKKIYVPLHEKMRDVEFVIVGKSYDDNQKKEWESYPNVMLTGFVDDLRAEYNKARVVVVPIYQGSGTNIKLLEAMQMNRACAVSEFATRGVNDVFINKEDYLASTSDSEFLENLEMLLTDEQMNHRLAKNAYSKMQRYYSFESFKAIVSKAIVK